MRVYLPSSMPGLAELRKTGELGPAPLTGFAVTPALREWYISGDIEELEYAALTEAARGSLRLLVQDPLAARRRVVLAADVADAAVRPAPELDRAVVRITEAIPLAKIASVHVDDETAALAISEAVKALPAADLGDDDAQFTVDGAEDHELLWYATQEIPDLC